MNELQPVNQNVLLDISEINPVNKKVIIYYINSYRTRRHGNRIGQ